MEIPAIDGFAVLNKVNRKLMLVNAHSQIRHRYRKTPLWAFVKDITGYGSTSSVEVCKECGWDAFADGSKPIKW